MKSPKSFPLVSLPLPDDLPLTPTPPPSLPKIGVPAGASPDDLTEAQRKHFARLDIDADSITWKRVTDTNDRHLRAVEVGLSPTEVRRVGGGGAMEYRLQRVGGLRGRASTPSLAKRPSPSRIPHPPSLSPLTSFSTLYSPLR